MKGASLCEIGEEQSPIKLTKIDTQYTNKMQVNGYGYEDFFVSKDMIKLPTHQIDIDSGEFILNLFCGRK